MRWSATDRGNIPREWEGGGLGGGGAVRRDRHGAPTRNRRLGFRWRVFLWTVAVLMPTILAGIYYGLVATDRYVSEARFLVRTASKPANMLGGLNALLQLVGMSRSQDDAYAVRDYLTSRDVIRALNGQIDLRKLYEDPSADFLAHYPSFLFNRSDEDFFRYFEYMLSVVVNEESGLTILKVEAFRPGDAQRIAQALLQQGEEMVNRLNARMQEDAVKVAATEVQRAEQNRVAAEVAVTEFRNRELLLDPDKNALMLAELIGKLAGELADVQSQIATVRGNAPNSPQLATLIQRAAALQQQIDTERGRISGTSGGLADKIAHYEQLTLGRKFSIRRLTSAVQALDAARLDARRQQLFLERVVEPNLPDDPTAPHRWRMVLTVFGFNVIGMGVIWLLGSGLREHAAARREH